MSFPKGFVWGAAAASYQVEGAAYEDGKGLSVWDMFCKNPGAIWNGHTGDMACDHYHRYQEDVALMKEIGLHAYRLSISWPRVLPEGIGTINTQGLDFYDRLVDELLAAGITPYITLFHWDYPYELYSRGSWLNPDSPEWFAEYTKVVVDKLSDRVTYWMTFNEPQAFIGLGYHEGRHAPGDRLGFAQVLRIGHNMLLAHGKSVQMVRACSKTPCQVGYAPVGFVRAPATERTEDIEAARQATFSAVGRHWRQSIFEMTEKSCWNNTWWMDPVILGRYPEDGVKLFEADMPKIRDGDMQTICQPLDFLGLNIYFGWKFQAGTNGQPDEVLPPVGYAQTAFRWIVMPEVLYWGPKFFWERYQIPIMITENGMSNIDWIALDGKVHDPQRIDFLNRYLLQLQKACEDGVDLRGYFQWSIMDNFEWAEGYKERFGLIYVDYPSQKRILKDSAYWYQEVITSNGAILTK
ncbi:MAG: GH1 family beta-glucosidase [Anaerolineales bacterium]